MPHIDDLTEEELLEHELDYEESLLESDYLAIEFSPPRRSRDIIRHLREEIDNW